MATDTAIVILGVGGPTSSGKTSLAKNLLAILQPPADASSPIAAVHVLHQDDFTPPKAEIPWNDTWKVQDWDTPHGSCNYRRLERVLQYFIEHHALPPDFQSSEHRRSNYSCSLPQNELALWRQEFHIRAASQLVHSSRCPPARKVVVLIVEGFLIYYDAAVRNLFDIRLFLRVSKATMLRRRTERQNYVLEDGQVWEDPPFYFDEIVWPAYVEAHGHMFEQGDVEHGALVKTSTNDAPDGGPVKDMVLLEAEGYTKEQTCRSACEHILSFLYRST
ncbi:hypothetical protein MCAP1_003424 [Malassezia caprae]|uniref:Nicotinamide riboside kinase n=1 Tax=Malassezia caprae TaxID=1381934 RepID=A0AAF0EA76_9BASI|nr:hypothetical protein MCAP1_003424 [Malassezia caprae]